MRDDLDRAPADLDRVIQERLAAAGPFESAQFDPQVLRDAFALAEQWRLALRAGAATPDTPPAAPAAL